MWIWFGLAVAFLMVEAATTELVAVWFALSALVMGIVVAFAPALGLVWQISIAVALSVILLLATRPLVKKLMKKSKHRETNLDLVINHIGIVVEAIDNDLDTGAVKINGLIWSARSQNGNKIALETLVTVSEIQGNKLIVKEKIEN